jgi:hypothetical protein
LINVQFNQGTVDFFEGQGFYDNTIACDPFDENKVYFGGVSLFRSTVGTTSTTVNNFKMEEVNTQSFLLLQSFANMPFDNSRLVAGDAHNGITVELRFGPGELQKGHRFTVPVGATSNVGVNQYTYNDYVNVPFEVWDVNSNRQLMVSFRDQNRNGKFDLVANALESPTPADQQSREYIYIHNVNYNPTTASSTIAKTGGQELQLMYNFFPALAANAIWNENSLPASKVIIKNFPVQKFDATTVTVADGRGSFDNKNKSNQVDLTKGVHPDHHIILPVIVNQAEKTYKLVIGNDGGVFVSKVSANPGITEGDWVFKGAGLNTSQFYGADKKPGAEEYIGGMQDNGTRISPAGQAATALSNYNFAIDGDGFEVLWHSVDGSKILGSSYNGQISRSINSGVTWQNATSGFIPSGDEFPFVTKLAHSKDFPDRVFTVGKQGVYVSTDFGFSWKLSAISDKFSSSTASPIFLDVEVSRANANIVWAGTGMFNTGTLRNLHVSTDGGKSFSITNNYTLKTLGNITRLASHPTEPNTAYALFSFAKSPKILRTTDRGQSWQDISGFNNGNMSTNGFPDVAVYCLYVRPDNPSIIWAGTEIGLVESTNNGLTWSVVSDFPNVSVWDMKGQDNQVVIATHGRGIWTATINASQGNPNAPQIVTSGTAPNKSLMLRAKSASTFDSVQVLNGNTKIKTVKPFNAGTTDINIPNISPGQKEITLVGYKGSAPIQSLLHTMTHVDLLTSKNSYATYFSSLTDLQVDGLTLQSFSGNTAQQRQTLQTNHSYSVNKMYEVLVRTPVTVSSTLPFLYYSDIAIVEPDKDSVFIEASKNGLDWILLKAPYDANYSGDAEHRWQTAFTGNQPGATAMFLKHEIDLRTKFNAGDLLLFRLRMGSGPATTSWGWALDYISIQEKPVSIERQVQNRTSLTLYPNPAKEKFTVAYSLQQSSMVTLQIMDVFGRQITKQDLGNKNAGVHSHTVESHRSLPGTYLVVLTTNEGMKVAKLTTE